MSTHRLALIGYGGMAGWHHRNIRDRIPSVEVACTYDIRPEVAETAAENGLEFRTTLEAVLSDPTIDIVTIATPNNFHKELAIAALEAGKAVVCEKPVTLNAAELEEIIAVSKRTGKLFSVHQNRRWDRDYAVVQEILKQNLIGNPYFIESRVQGSGRFLHGWRGHKVNGGGIMLDWGVHMIDQLMDLIDSPVVSVDTKMVSLFNEGVDDNFKMFLTFENGIVGLVEIACNCFINLPRWHISATEGTAVIDNWDCEGKIVRLTGEAMMQWEDQIVYTSAGPTRTMAPRPKHTITELPLPEVTADWVAYYENIAAVLDGKADLIVRPEQALRVMKVIDAAFESSKSGKSISLRV